MTSVAVRHGVVDLGLPDGLSYDEWLAKGQAYQAMAQSAMFWLGDYLAYGEDRFSERYAQAVAALGLSPHTAQNAVWVARKIPRSRRREGLSFGHHAELAGLPEPEQEEWFERIEDGGWTRADLRREMGRAKALAEPAHRHKWRCACGDEMVEGGE